MGLCGGLVALSVATRAAFVLVGAPPLWGHMLTPARFDGLAVGSWIALAARGPGGVGSLQAPARWAGLGAAAGLVVLFESPWAIGPLREVLGPLLLAVGYGGLLALLLGAREGSRLHSAFGGRFLVLLGINSYALYLFHNPIQAAIRDLVYGPGRFPRVFGSPLPGQVLFYVLAGVPALALAMLSRRYFEGPILGLKRHFPSGAGGGSVPAGASSSSGRSGGRADPVRPGALGS
jgi:peptidoglycan/LPS O-acetylase OafA/YrhL